MNYEDDPQAWRERLSAKLAPARVRSTLAFAGLFQMTHEMIKRTVIDDVKGFFGYSLWNDGTWFLGRHAENEYKRDVLALKPGRVFKASLKWFNISGAITSTQVVRLEEIYDYRHDVTHELARFIVEALTCRQQEQSFRKSIHRGAGFLCCDASLVGSTRRETTSQGRDNLTVKHTNCRRTGSYGCHSGGVTMVARRPPAR